MSRGWADRLADGATGLRTAAYRAVSPLERWLRPPAAAGKPTPPLWLRRHAGPVSAFHSSARDAVELLERLGLLRAGSAVLDFGCGPGALVPLLAARLGPDGRYLGLDVHAPSIGWCAAAWRPDPRLAFALLPAVAGAAWPADAAAFDLVLAKSVFTHLLEPEAAWALGEARRVLRPGGRALLTAFTFDGARFEGRQLPWFSWPDPRSDVRWRRRHRPTAAVAWERSRFERLVAAAGFAVETCVPGFFPGGAAPPAGQDTFELAARG